VFAAGVALCAGLVASLWSYRDALRSRDQAKQEEAIARGVGRFLSEDVLGAPSRFAPSVRRDVRVVDVLDRAAAELDHRQLDSPLIEAAVRSSIAYSYLQMSSFAAARQQTAKAAKLYARVLGATDSRTLHAEYEEAEDLIFDSKYAAAEQLLNRLDADLAIHPAGDPDVYLASAVLRGAVYFHAERFAEALPYYQKALIEHQRIHPTEPAGLSVREQMLAFTYAHLGRFGEADRHANQALAAARQVTDANADTILALARETRGVVLYLERLYPEAEQELTQSYRVLSARLGPDAEESADSGGYLARVYLLSGRSGAAEQILRPAYAGVVARFGENNRSTALVQTVLGAAECDNGEWQAGLNDLRKAVAVLRVVLGESAPSTQWARYSLASAVLQSKSAVVEAVSLRSGLDAAVLGLVDPKQPWSAMLQLLDGRLRLATSDRQP
jgi:tetratricopeptide (TPR) repeat protein